jgi:hypothetical protein
MGDRSRVNAHNHALPPPRARATIETDDQRANEADPVDELRYRREGNMTSHRNTPTIPDGPSVSPPRRFSEGMERMPLAPSSSRVGRFSDGIARSPLSASAQRIGCFADGLALRPNARSARRVGSFSDGFARGGGERGTVPRVDSQRNTEEGRIAA